MCVCVCVGVTKGTDGVKLPVKTQAGNTLNEEALAMAGSDYCAGAKRNHRDLVGRGVQSSLQQAVVLEMEGSSVRMYLGIQFAV